MGEIEQVWADSTYMLNNSIKSCLNLLPKSQTHYKLNHYKCDTTNYKFKLNSYFFWWEPTPKKWLFYLSILGDRRQKCFWNLIRTGRKKIGLLSTSTFTQYSPKNEIKSKNLRSF
jgi:hypothetical protein